MFSDLKRAIIHISWAVTLAVLILSGAGECVAPGQSAGVHSHHEGILGELDDCSISLNGEISRDLRCVDEALVKECATEYGIDFRLILAIIKHESSFDEDAVSDHGAEGLMQIMPVTHLEISEAIDVQNPFVPRDNIRAGVYYVSKLSELFKDARGDDRISLVLAAYNAGPARIYDAQELAAYMGESPRSWSSMKAMLPLLSRRYYSLHQAVWNNGRPPNGFFGCSLQTIRYVENIMETYHSYLQPG